MKVVNTQGGEYAVEYGPNLRSDAGSRPSTYPTRELAEYVGRGVERSLARMRMRKAALAIA